MSERKGLLARLLNLPAMPAAASAGSRETEAGPWVPPEPMRIPMKCSATGGWISLLSEESDTVLRIVDYEIPQALQQGGDSTQPRLLSGEYSRIEFPPGWLCPLCGNNSWWTCGCDNFSGALHCRGNIGGEYHCACGLSHKHDFSEIEKFWAGRTAKFRVLGITAATAATPDKTMFISGPSQLKQVSYKAGK